MKEGEEHRGSSGVTFLVIRPPATVTNATTTTRARVLAVAFRRWTVEHTSRLGKQEAGLMDYAGWNYTGPLRHLTLALIVLGFVATHTQRLGGTIRRS